MPKKTKRDKLLAEYRRKLQVINVHTSPAKDVNSSSLKTTTSSYSLHSVVQKREEQPVFTKDILFGPTPKEYQLIKKDLRITLGIVCILFFIEYILWKFVFPS